MIFNTLDYYILFLLPAALAFKLAPVPWRPWVITLSASGFFVYFSLRGFGGVIGALCLSIFYVVMRGQPVIPAGGADLHDRDRAEHHTSGNIYEVAGII